MLFASDGNAVSLRNKEDVSANLLMLAGSPFNEPVSRYGPFVMNTWEEIIQAFRDYQEGRMGVIS